MSIPLKITAVLAVWGFFFTREFGICGGLLTGLGITLIITMLIVAG